jgi:hypothetical protein
MHPSPARLSDMGTPELRTYREELLALEGEHGSERYRERINEIDAIIELRHHAPLHERLNHLALNFQERANADYTTADGLREFLRDHAYSLGEFARQCEEEYVRTAGGEDEKVPTVAQGVALARFLRGEWSHGRIGPGDRYAHVSQGGAGLPESYVHVVFPATGYEGGIDRDGRVST